MASDTLRNRLQLAAQDALMGQNLGPGLASRLELATLDELRSAGIPSARVTVRQQGRGFVIQVRLPPAPDRVRELVLRIG
jgi:hypothetical protein